MTSFLKIYPKLPPIQGDIASANGSQSKNKFRFSIKDLFDVAGEVTTAGSVVLANNPPALTDSLAVGRLKNAGGWPIGRTNMSEFAFSGVGFNPHFGTPINPHPLARRPHPERITGGSSSGAAASVGTQDAKGLWLADIGLGTDTGGSLRIPAALCGLVGFKSTARLIPTAGVLPLSPSLDTVGAITRNVNDAIWAHEILAARTVERFNKPLSNYRIGVVRTLFEVDMDETVRKSWARTLKTLNNAGANLHEIELEELFEIAHINRNGGFSPIEAYRWHQKVIDKHKSLYDPRVAQRILHGAKASEDDYQTLLTERADWIARVTQKLAGLDAILSPTVPIVAPTIASSDTDDTEFFRVNGLLLRNPSAINFLDGCAISIPCQEATELPVGLMIWHAALHDDSVLNVALEIEKIITPLK
jgi:aspartyl-tRNA(Asn)/glutamyl-tRNA(Gln) amidotransferase subunit A